MKALLLILQYLPGVLNAVAAVHAAQGAQTPPATTTQIILDSIKAGAEAAEGIPEPHVQLVAAITASVAGSLATPAAPAVPPVDPTKDPAKQAAD